MAIRQSIESTSVVISGAGIAGLMAALEFWRHGFDVRILERTAHSATSGDSFTIGPTATCGFKHWPMLLQRNREIAYHPLVAYHSISGERLKGPMELNTLMTAPGEEEEPLPELLRHSRPKFHRMLLDQLSETGINVEYGCEVVDYGEDDKTGKGFVQLKSGKRVEADLVVAADGVRGNSWPLVVGEPVPAKSTGDAIFRVAFDVNLAMSDPVVRERFPMTDDGRSVIELWSGSDISCVFWRNEDQMSIALNHSDHGNAEESWSQHSSPAEMLKYTAQIPNWPDVADRVIKLIPQELLMDFKLMWREPQPICASPAGHVVQIGDAAHTFLPSSGYGGTQAMEDAISLAACMAKALTESYRVDIGVDQNLLPTSNDKAEKIKQAARIHNLLRFERVSCLQAFGVDNRRKFSSGNKSAADVKKNALHLPQWILRHDPEDYVQEKYTEAMNHLVHGTEFKNTNIPKGMEYVPWTIDGLLAARERGEKTVLDGDWS